MTNGFLLIDQQKNSVIVPWDDPDLAEFFKGKPGRENALEKVHLHKTVKELDADVRAYLKGEYDG